MSKLLTAVVFALTSGAAIAADDAYTALDADQNGSISAAEADAMPALKDKWNTLDVDANGELSVEEFAQFETTEVEVPATEEAPAAQTATEAPAAE